MDRVVLRLEIAGRDVAREDQVKFQRAAAAATRDKRGHREGRTANGPRDEPLEPRQHSRCSHPSPHTLRTHGELIQATLVRFAAMLRYQAGPPRSSGARSMALSPSALFGRSLNNTFAVRTICPDERRPRPLAALAAAPQVTSDELDDAPLAVLAGAALGASHPLPESRRLSPVSD